MKIHFTVLLVGAAFAGGALIQTSPAPALPLQAAPQQLRNKEETSPEMEKKVDSARMIVSGLAREDFDLIREGATSWKRLSENAAWHKNRTLVYLNYSREFERACDRLIDAADQKSTERATFAYIQATVSCVACHEHVRNSVQMSPRSGPDTGKADTRRNTSDRGTVIR